MEESKNHRKYQWLQNLLWFLFCFFIGILSFRLRIGETFEFKNDILNTILQFLYYRAILVIGGILGLLTFIFFKIIDSKLVRRKANSKWSLFIFRLISILSILTILSLLHYILEFELDWI
ncbi:hypothetical protein [Tenacibaculum sp. 190524A05c]|uniref:Uncharacterized protein n=1 Tax=Tenacibaculum platacis TaxID=3137852 RepID=A0ABM9P0M7_9FLAO